MVEQRDARLDQDQRTEVRIAPADRRGGVDDRGDPRIHEPFGGHAIQVLVVDHRDVSRLRHAGRGPSCDGRRARRRPRALAGSTSGATLGSWTWTCGLLPDWPIRPIRLERDTFPPVPAGVTDEGSRRLPWSRNPGRMADVRSASGGAAGCGCGRQELLRVGDGALAAREPGEHPRELVDTLVVGQRHAPSRSPRPSRRRMWRSAKHAICGRWVTTSTWRPSARRASRRPTASPASPPMPASTSSNTSVGTSSRSAITLRHASIVRESSPPDAVLASDDAFCPGDGESRSSTTLGPRRPELGSRIQFDRDRGARHPELLQLALERPRQRRRRVRPAPA